MNNNNDFFIPGIAQQPAQPDVNSQAEQQWSLNPPTQASVTTWPNGLAGDSAFCPTPEPIAPQDRPWNPLTGQSPAGGSDVR